MNDELPGQVVERIMESGLFIPVVTAALEADQLGVEFLCFRQPSAATGTEESFVVAFTSKDRLLQAMPGWERWVNPHVTELIGAMSHETWMVIDPPSPECLELKFGVLQTAAEAVGLAPPTSDRR